MIIRSGRESDYDNALVLWGGPNHTIGFGLKAQVENKGPSEDG